MSVAVLDKTLEISVKGKRTHVPALQLDDVTVIMSGRVLKVARIFDEYWVRADTLPDPEAVIAQLKAWEGRPDLFTFAQRAPHSTPRFNFHTEWDNVAAIPISTHEHWLQKQISSASRRNVKAAEKKGITVRVCPYDEAYVRGVMSIFNESPVRHGRKYWHYGKDFATVQAENGTYSDRSVYLGAYVGDEMVGYTKIVFDRETAAIMQILSKMQYFDRRPNNAMLSEAVKVCAERGVGHLLYESFVYGNKTDSSLTRFKRDNGFVRMDLPRYFVPVSSKGQAALSLGAHRDLKDRLPQWLTSRLLRARDQWYERRNAPTDKPA
jgi:hypothetical protein